MVGRADGLSVADPSPFSDRAVWVTGAASGMGACFARRFAELGARVGCIDVAEGVGKVAAGIEAAGGIAVAARADVTDADSVAAAGSELERALGPVEVAVLGAGVPGTATSVAELDPAEWDRVLAVNLSGLFLTMRAAIPQLRRGERSAIVAIASAAGLATGPGYAPYYASKHGAIGLMRTAANELASDRIRVNAVCPGWVDTPMFEAQAAELGWDRQKAESVFTGDQLFGRLIEVDEVADAVIWLASPSAAMITGVALPVDGGLLVSQFSA